MIAITGASGHLGTLVIQSLLHQTPANQIIAAVRSPDQADHLRDLGVQLREADYDKPGTLVSAFQDVEKVLLISSVTPGQRLRQHTAVIDAAQRCRVQLFAYTSILRADTSTLMLAEEHKQTEAVIKASGLTYILLRNGWYLENHTGAIPAALEHGALTGSSGNGRFASAARADYADAAASVLTVEGHGDQTYELAGDHSFDMAALAAEVSKQVGGTITYKNLSPEDYRGTLLGLGLPAMLVDVALDADTQAQKGELDSSSKQLSELIGRPTTSLAQAVSKVLHQ